MFKAARLKLTAWYLAIIMAVSLLFSVAIYRGASHEVERSLRVQQFRLDRERRIDETLLIEANESIRLSLLLINLVVLSVSGVAGYFLAGRTLQPIEVMVEEQNRFITDSSHELRTPLTALKTSIEVGLRDKELKLPEAKQLLSSSLSDVNGLISFSNDLIRLTVYQKPNGNLNTTKLDIKKIIEESIRKVSPLAGEKKIMIGQKVQRSNLLADEKSVTELFVILLDNAIKYSGEGSKISISTADRGDVLMIKVKDAGTGISAEDLPHIFDRFYRADKSRSKEIAGFGIGLSIAKEIVTINRGNIKAESTHGRGTTFTVELPLHV